MGKIWQNRENRKYSRIDNKGDKFFYFPMISMACTGSGTEVESLIE